jgi:hypothetical protein
MKRRREQCSTEQEKFDMCCDDASDSTTLPPEKRMKSMPQNIPHEQQQHYRRIYQTPQNDDWHHEWPPIPSPAVIQNYYHTVQPKPMFTAFNPNVAHLASTP